MKRSPFLDRRLRFDFISILYRSALLAAIVEVSFPLLALSNLA